MPKGRPSAEKSAFQKHMNKRLQKTWPKVTKMTSKMESHFYTFCVFGLMGCILAPDGSWDPFWDNFSLNFNDFLSIPTYFLLIFQLLPGGSFHGELDLMRFTWKPPPAHRVQFTVEITSGLPCVVQFSCHISSLLTLSSGSDFHGELHPLSANA